MLPKLVLHGEIFNVISGYAPQIGCIQEEKVNCFLDLEALIRAVNLRSEW